MSSFEGFARAFVVNHEHGWGEEFSVNFVEVAVGFAEDFKERFTVVACCTTWSLSKDAFEFSFVSIQLYGNTPP